MQTDAIILAAGKGTRMNHPELPKVLVEANGRPVIAYTLDALAAAGVSDPVLVVGYKEERVREALGSHRYVRQVEQNGTGSAVRLVEPELGAFDGGIYLAYGDCPLVTRDTFVALQELLEANPDAALVVTTGQISSPEERYGRIVRRPDGAIERIVEFKDATDEERAITEYNAGPYIVRSPWLWAALRRMQPSPVTGEYYLTDIVQFANEDGFRVLAHPVANQEEALGVNTPDELARVARILQERKEHEAHD
ncbi:MAG: NTP transferase domain-containing protein [Patescibacteria group bacterium]|jgi:bifunctional UDP-N-acetylglucosamine pyrophosphorylase/glucosamine-1-phosphate N-acetyltransferase